MFSHCFSKFNLVIKNFVCAIDEILVNFLNCSVLSVFLNFKCIFDRFKCSLNFPSFDFKLVFFMMLRIYTPAQTNFLIMIL